MCSEFFHITFSTFHLVQLQVLNMSPARWQGVSWLVASSLANYGACCAIRCPSLVAVSEMSKFYHGMFFALQVHCLG